MTCSTWAGAKSVVLESDDAAKPAWFYMKSVPAGADIPHRLVTKAQLKPLDLGEERRANRRTLRMYIHPEAAPSSACSWASPISRPAALYMPPPHLHERRMEAYLYFDLAPEDRVVHLMGRPDNGNLMVANGDWASPGSGRSTWARAPCYTPSVPGMTVKTRRHNDVSPVKVAELR